MAKYMAHLTEWFPVAVSPARPGVYGVETPGAGANRYAAWDGKKWAACSYSLQGAAISKFESRDMHLPGAKWRGLAQEPKQ